MSIHIRVAGPSDADALRAMQLLSFRRLCAPYYDHDVMEEFISCVGTMDDALLEDGTYLAAVADGRIVGSGGWSWRVPGYVSRAAAEEIHGVTRAKVRSLFVHPEYARHGIARALMAEIEARIAAAGYTTAVLAATLSGVPFYRRVGYRGGDPIALALPSGRTLATLAMEKQIARAGVLAVA